MVAHGASSEKHRITEMFVLQKGLYLDAGLFWERHYKDLHPLDLVPLSSWILQVPVVSIVIKTTMPKTHTHVAIFAALGLLPVVRGALYDTVIYTPNGPVQGYPAFNSSPANMSLTNWRDVTVWYVLYLKGASSVTLPI